MLGVHASRAKRSLGAACTNERGISQCYPTVTSINNRTVPRAHCAPNQGRSQTLISIQSSYQSPDLDIPDVYVFRDLNPPRCSYTNDCRRSGAPFAVDSSMIPCFLQQAASYVPHCAWTALSSCEFMCRSPGRHFAFPMDLWRCCYPPC